MQKSQGESTARGKISMFHVKDLMTKKIFSVQESDNLLTARQLMDMARIRHIPVVGPKSEFIGLVTHRDILGATISRLAEIDETTQNEIDAGIPIKEIMRADVTTVGPDDTLRDAADILLHHKYGCLPVVQDGKLVGIITEADFLRLTITLMDALEKE
jgi:CBS domain-containing membrane protein